jgi:hypothetical protein
MDADGDRGRKAAWRWLAKWWPVPVGVVCGVMFRIVFSGHGGLSAMSLAFFYVVPVAVAAVAVYLAERRERRTWAYYAGAGALANLLFVLGTVMTAMEGAICAVLAAPIFAMYGALGGLAMGLVCRWTSWPNRGALGIATLPLIVAALVPADVEQDRIGLVERHLVVAAPAGAIWREIQDVRDIRPDELDAWMYRIGVPRPSEARGERGEGESVRRVRMGRNVHFDQVVVAEVPNRLIRWRYRFDDDSFPAGAMDDHVRIGGDHFDLGDTEYALEPLADGSTRFSVRFRYRVHTSFNWYASALADALIGNFEEAVLRFYARRASAS